MWSSFDQWCILTHKHTQSNINKPSKREGAWVWLWAPPCLQQLQGSNGVFSHPRCWEKSPSTVNTLPKGHVATLCGILSKNTHLKANINWWLSEKDSSSVSLPMAASWRGQCWVKGHRQHITTDGAARLDSFFSKGHIYSSQKLRRKSEDYMIVLLIIFWLW